MARRSKNRDLARILGRTANSRDADDTTALGEFPQGWTAGLSGTDMVFKYNNTSVVKIADSGEITSISDIGAYGNV